MFRWLRRRGKARRAVQPAERLPYVDRLEELVRAGLAESRPNLAPHINQMKSTSYQFAKGHDVIAVHRRPGFRRRISDFIKVSHMEMLHRNLQRPVGVERVLEPVGDRGLHVLAPW